MNFLCEICAKRLPKKTNLYDHKQRHQNGKFDCDSCSKVFLNKVSLLDHKEDFINATGNSLGRVNDQLIEAVHSYMNKRMVRSNYWVKEVTTEKHGEQLYKCILHINTYNI